jgi:hypothetical protein
VPLADDIYSNDVYYQKIDNYETEEQVFTIEIPEGENFIDIKYRKDGSSSNGLDALQVKILLS